jgi:hypothetical protein
VNKSPKNSTFGDTLFGGSRLIFWSLGPLFLLVAICAAYFGYAYFAVGRFGAGGLAVAMALICVCFFLGLLNGPHFWWAGRVVAASVFGAYLWYLLDTWLIHPRPSDIGGRRGDATPWNALCGLVAIGWPSLLYTFLGRFTLRAPPPPGESFSDYEEDSHREHPNDNTRNA